MGKKLLFVTNDLTKSRRQSADKFHTLGLDVRQVYVIGEEGILEELELAGYTSIEKQHKDGKKTIQLRPNSLFEHDKNVGAVIVGLEKI